MSLKWLVLVLELDWSTHRSQSWIIKTFNRCTYVGKKKKIVAKPESLKIKIKKKPTSSEEPKDNVSSHVD